MPETSYKRSVLLVVALAYFMAPFMSMSLNVALPSIGRELVIDAVLLAWLPTSFILSSAMVVVPAGRIADIYGRKRIFLYGTILSALTSFILAFSTSALFLLIFRFIQGFGAAMLITTGLAIVSSVYPANERGKAIGICATAVYSGQSLTPLLSGLLTQHLGWRSIFFMNVPLGLLVIVFVLWKWKDEWAEAQGAKFDTSGTLIYALTVFAIVYGVSSLPARGALWFIIAGFAGIVAFVKWETRVPSPILDINLFKNNRVFRWSVAATFINFSASFAIAFLMSLYLQYIKGFSPQNAGFILVTQPLVQALFSPLAGRLADRIQPRIVASIGMALTCLGLFTFVFLTAQTTLTSILTSLGFIGFGLAFFAAPNTNAIMGSAGRKNYGVASGTAATMRQVGMMFSMALAMLVFSLFMGRVEVTPEYYPLFLRSVKILFLIFGFLSCLGVFASLARGKVVEGEA